MANLTVMMGIVRQVFPNATVGEDMEGQLVIYTDCKVDGMGEVLPLEAADLPYEEAD